ncbi:MAG: hypothetical protein NTX79_04970 [Candidatus Micrarchaeota archaeon]|nr:hypothetical protein [Candidatus Micrarchaeota archaeon]
MGMPESQLIRGECLVRDLQFNEDVKLTRKALVRWLALSLGLISQNETRAGLLEVLEALLYFHFAKKQGGADPDIYQILDKVKEIKKKEPNPKAVRYHLLQLKKLGIIEAKTRRYRFVLPPMQENDDLASALSYVYHQRMDSSFEKIKKALSVLEKTL